MYIHRYYIYVVQRLQAWGSPGSQLQTDQVNTLKLLQMFTTPPMFLAYHTLKPAAHSPEFHAKSWQHGSTHATALVHQWLAVLVKDTYMDPKTSATTPYQYTDRHKAETAFGEARSLTAL